jgi:hypothetical protein
MSLQPKAKKMWLLSIHLIGLNADFVSSVASHLFYWLKAQNQYLMPVGIFDSVEQFIFDHQIFIEEKPEYYCFSNETQNMTGSEVFAMFAAATEP